MLRTWKRIAALHAVSPGQPRRPLRTGALFYRTLHSPATPMAAASSAAVQTGVYANTDLTDQIKSASRLTIHDPKYSYRVGGVRRKKPARILEPELFYLLLIETISPWGFLSASPCEYCYICSSLLIFATFLNNFFNNPNVCDLLQGRYQGGLISVL